MAYDTRNPRDNTIILTPQSIAPTSEAEGQIVRMNSTNRHNLYTKRNEEWRSTTLAEDIVVEGKSVIGIGNWKVVGADIELTKTTTQAIDLEDFVINVPDTGTDGQYIYYDFYVPSKYTIYGYDLIFTYFTNYEYETGDFTISIQKISDSSYLIEDESLLVENTTWRGYNYICNPPFEANTNYRFIIKCANGAKGGLALQFNNLRFQKPLEGFPIRPKATYIYDIGCDEFTGAGYHLFHSATQFINGTENSNYYNSYPNVTNADGTCSIEAPYTGFMDMDITFVNGRTSGMSSVVVSREYGGNYTNIDSKTFTGDGTYTFTNLTITKGNLYVVRGYFPSAGFLAWYGIKFYNFKWGW